MDVSKRTCDRETCSSTSDDARSEVLGRIHARDIRVLLIEPCELTSNTVAAALNLVGYEVISCQLSELAFSEVSRAHIILLNLGLPGVDPLRFLAELRLASSIPIVVYSRNRDADYIAAALNCGADDHMIEPLRSAELLARIKAISRRIASRCPPEQTVRTGDIEVRLRTRRVAVDGQPIRITPTEFEILSLLARSSGVPVSREDIMHEVWGRVSPAVSRTLDVHMTALRTKLRRPNLLLTIRGYGYVLGGMTHRWRTAADERISCAPTSPEPRGRRPHRGG